MKKLSMMGALLTLGLVAGCGGGGGGGGSDGGTTTPTAKTTTEVMAGVSASTLQLDRSASAQGSVNSDGVRGDVATWIGSQGYTSAMSAAATQLARAYQGAITVGTTDADALRTARTAASDAVECVMQSAASIDAGYKALADVRRVTLNTDARASAYLAYAAAVNDTVVRAPEGTGCTSSK
ncbi:MAG: hypothetical protein RL654_2390 [Pseudomonadota bacterium]